MSTCLAGALLVLMFPVHAAAAPRLYLDPATTSVAAGSQVTIKLLIDTDGQEVVGADATLTVPEAFLEAISVTAGTFFSGLDKSINSQTGAVELHGYISADDVQEVKTGKGTVATISFKGIAPGTASLFIPCTTGATVDANIVDETGKDVISCTAVTGAVVSVTQTATAGALTPTPTPSVLPEAGGVGPTAGLAGIGLLMLIAGVMLTIRKEVVV